MNNKRKRDELANLEKEAILNPHKLEEKKRKKKSRRLIVALLSVILAVGIVFASYEAVRAIGKSNLKKKVEATHPVLEQVETEPIPVSEDEEWKEGWISYNGKIYEYKEDIMTFLIMGIDKNSEVVEVDEGTEGGQADALFLAVMDPDDRSIKVIGINRNTMTDIDVYNETGSYVTTIEAQICIQHGFGNGLEKSCEYQKQAVSKLFYNLPIHGYAAINMSAIPTINDAVGGVDVTVLEDLTRIDESLVEGQTVHLMGKSAFWYVKYRDTSVFGSADMRLARQKQYLNAFIKTAKNTAKSDIGVALDVYQAVSSMMTTDITADEVAYLAPILVDYQFNSDSFYMLDGETVMGEEFEEFYADEDALYELILEVFYREVER